MQIFMPLQVGNLRFKNRIMFPPLTTGYEARDGSITTQSLNFYKRLAEGGVAYIVLGDVAPVPTLSPTPRLISDEQLSSFRALTDTVHAHGAYIGAQVFHPDYDTEGVMALFKTGDMAALGKKIHHDMEHFCNDVSIERLDEIRERMIACAVRCEKAGFDVIQVHGDRLLGMLSSPVMNRRNDLYGGSLENRARFALELVRGIRAACPDIAIEYKLSMIRTNPTMGKGGPTIEEGQTMARWLREAGVDFFHAVQANHTAVGDTLPAMGIQPYACFADMAEAIKSAVDAPVSAVGRILTPEMAEGIVASGVADLVALGRQLLADPDWVRKAERGETIRYCIMCNKGCTDKITGRKQVGCVLNAENGHEYERVIRKTDAPKKILVAGGGPAGLEAARVLALRGHRVALYEKEERFGGQVNIAAVPPRKDELRRLTAYQVKAAREAGVALAIGQEIDAALIAREKPDAVVVAIGAVNLRLSVPGADLPHVLDAWEVLSGVRQCMPKVAVIGGGLVGVETAEYLAASQGLDVAIVEMLDDVAKEESSSVRPTLIQSLNRHGVALYTGHELKEICFGYVLCENTGGKEVRIPCDSVVMAAGAKPRTLDVPDGVEAYRVGDCAGRPADIEKAIHTAYLLACEL